MTDLSNQARKLARTVQLVAKEKGLNEEASLLALAQATLLQTGIDTAYDGDTELYTLVLEVPVSAYVKVEDNRARIEKSVLGRVRALTRPMLGMAVTEVVISPAMSDDETARAADAIEAEPSPKFWAEGKFRLFLSHPSAVKQGAHTLKVSLARFDVAAFVAHDDIEPTTEWQDEIESALRTMDALAAIITPDFLGSRWCDQEVGIAIGRGKLVVPLRAGADPHGFLAKYQGIKIAQTKADDIARKVVEVLISHPLTTARMVEVLVQRMERATGWDGAKQTMTLLELAPELTADQSTRLVAAVHVNGEVREAFTVPERINALVARVGAQGAA